MKIVYSDAKTGRTGQMELAEDKATMLLNKKVGEVIDGNLFGMPGYKLKITGGSDTSGFPIDRSVDGTRRATVFKALKMSGREKGKYQRKGVRGNMISTDIMQINTLIVEVGEKPIDELLPKKEKVKKEATPKEGAEEKKA